jgi:hypothetical protein
MSDSDRSRSPFAGLAYFSTRPPVRVLSADEIKQMLAEHRLYLETEYHQGHRANFTSADLSGRDFSGLNLRGIKMDRAVLRGADFTGAHLQRANLIGVISQEARFDSADLSGARLSGANLEPSERPSRTFTRRAALEMTRRSQLILAEARGNAARDISTPSSLLPWSGTFHAIGSRLLRLHAGSIGLDSTFTVLDRTDSADLLDLVRNEHGLSRTASRSLSAAARDDIVARIGFITGDGNPLDT